MAGRIKKTMIYLGLADDDGLEERVESRVRERVETESRDHAPSRQNSVRASEESRARSSEEYAKAPAPRSSREEQSERRTNSSEDEPVRSSYRNSERAESREQGREEDRRRSSRTRREATVTPISRTALDENEDTVHEIVTIHPKSYNDAKLIGDSFRNGIPVIMNVTDLPETEAKRLVDFSAGLVYGLSGHISRVTNKVFLLTPETIDVHAEGESDSSVKDDDPLLVARS